MESQIELTPDFVLQEYRDFFTDLFSEIKLEERNGNTVERNTRKTN